MKSMTAYARCEKSSDDITVIASIRSYNSRFFDLTLKIKPEYEGLETKIRKVVSEKISRGSILLGLYVENRAGSGLTFSLDKDSAKSYYATLLSLKKILGIKQEISLDLIAGRTELIEVANKEEDNPSIWKTVKATLCTALDQLDEMRRIEGEFIAHDMGKRLAFIKDAIAVIEKKSENIISFYKKKLYERIKELTKGITETDFARIDQEAAILASKSDISEEISRAKSHAKQFETIAASNEPCGKKLNFLLQEFNREFNTMGAKTNSTEVSSIVVEIKAELEKIREQVQNIE